jgi:orotidine-5'-phosphate decarboxylase
MALMTKLIIALDTSNIDQAVAWAHKLQDHCDVFKLGLEFFTANGPDGVARISAFRPVMLDLKLHDIPNTVAGAVRAACALNLRFITVHASGGAKMIAAAAETRNSMNSMSVGPRIPLILAVTVLTSLNDDALDGIGFKYGVVPTVTRLANIAMFYGADGIVCSPHEAAALRSELGPYPILVVPGIRPAGAETGDQARTMTPREAATAGADYIVVGRPITRAADPVAAAIIVQTEIA